MKVTIYGAGGVGGYFGALLAEAGHEVAFIARGAHLDAIRQHGLRIKSPNGDIHLKKVRVSDTPGAFGQVDYLVVAVKHYHLEQVVPQLRLMIGDGTTVIPLLNGVDAHHILIQALGTEPVVGGLCSVVSMIESPGVIYQPSALRRVIVGELDGKRSQRVERILREWVDCGVEAVQPESIHVAIWTKYLFIASFGGVTSLAQATAGEMLACAETRALFIQAMGEVEALARAQRIDLAMDVVEQALAMTERFEPEATSSMQRDLADGKLFELEAFSGEIVRLGRDLGVPTPVHNAIYALLLPALERAYRSSMKILARA